MMGQQPRVESLFYYFRLEDQISEDHLLRLIDRYALARHCGQIRQPFQLLRIGHDIDISNSYRRLIARKVRGEIP